MIALVAALSEELGPLSRRLAEPRYRTVGALRLRIGRLSGREVCLLTTGVGARLASRGVGALLDEAAPERLIGIGVAGGLSADLEVADLVRGARVIAADGECLEPGAAWPAGLAGSAARPGTIVSVERIVATGDDKKRLARRLEVEPPAVVDLESAAWARAAARRELPWCVVRAVSDLSNESLPVDFERFRTADGEISRTRLAAHVALRPALALDLERLRRRVRRCAEALADAAEELVRCA